MKHQQRLQSLDVLRGFDMFFIMGGGALLVAFSQFLPSSIHEIILEQMGHAEWSGFTFYDMIFPLFLFIAGVSFPFSLAKQIEYEYTRCFIVYKIIKRGAVLILLGLLYNGILQFHWEEFRYASVLARIGLGWMLAAMIYINTNTMSRIVICLFILIAYWLLLSLVPSPLANGADIFSMQGSIVGYIDQRIVPGKLLLEIHDPEGLASTLPATVTALLGMFVGDFIRKDYQKMNSTKKAISLFSFGLVLCAIGQLWDIILPINKSLWTSSFVCFVGGLSIMLFAAFYYIIDVRKIRGWTFFFKIIGLNSIAIYLVQRIINFEEINLFFTGGLISLLPSEWGIVLSAIGYIAVCWLFLFTLYKHNIFLKV